MSTTEKKVYPGHTDEAHPEIFNTVPPIKLPLKPGQLNEQQLKQFFKDGYMILNDFFRRDELDPGRTAVDDLVDNLANKLYNAGKVKSLYSEYGFNDRLTKLEGDFPGANIILHKLGKLPPGLRDIWSNERLLNLAEQILDTGDISGHPVWNLRTKTPRNDATTVPWHQDVAYLDQRSYKTHILTAWIPLVDADEQNGCMQVLRGGHKTGKVADHQCCWAGTWYAMMVEDDIQKKLECDPVKDVITCDIPYGGLLIFNNMTPHRSTNNFSNIIRWSLDFRWYRAGDDPCLHNMKDGVQMRSSTDPNFTIDWDRFNAVDRHKAAHKMQGLVKDESEIDEFDTRIQGPFMHAWEIVHENHHTKDLPPESHWTKDNITIVG